MKKEVILAIAIGFGIGLVATFGIYNAQKSLKEASKIQTPLASEETGAGQGNIHQSLSLASPLDESLSKESKVIVSGTTTPSSWVIILAEKGEKMLQADSRGNFETEINLISGENEIEVQSISETGEKVNKVITVVYSTAEI